MIDNTVLVGEIDLGDEISAEVYAATYDLDAGEITRNVRDAVNARLPKGVTIAGYQVLAPRDSDPSEVMHAVQVAVDSVDVAAIIDPLLRLRDCEYRLSLMVKEEGNNVGEVFASLVPVGGGDTVGTLVLGTALYQAKGAWWAIAQVALVRWEMLLHQLSTNLGITVHGGDARLRQDTVWPRGVLTQATFKVPRDEEIPWTEICAVVSAGPKRAKKRA